MSKPWRNTAILLFLGALLFGGLAGDKILAVTDETQSQLHLYTEMLLLAHENYGNEVAYRDLVHASVDGMLRTLDPHTNFLTPEDYERMRDRQRESFYGLGILVSMRNGQLTVISPIEGTPAWRQGIRAGDIISAIEGEPTDTMSLDESVSKLKGPKGTSVQINIVRRGLDNPLKITVERAEIPQTTVRYAYMMEPGTGYIRLTDFSRSTAGEMAEALEKLKGENMDRLILDLRSNGGGLLDQTVEVSNFFVPEGTRIVETRGRLASSYQSYHSDGEHDPLDMPVVVLVNRGTASAAEILAGAIQDHDVGLVAGTPTWGKGLVQTVYNLSYNSGIALTTAKYYTPSGRLIQRDYSSFFDYYYTVDQGGDDPVDGVDEAPEIDTETHPEFVTDLGRKVYGGGGITPDVQVDLPNGPAGLQFLFAHNAFFDFAVDFHGEHKAEIEKAGDGWQPPENFLELFRAWLLEEELAKKDEVEEMLADEELREVARRQIHSDIFTAAFGTEASHRILAQGDAQILAAIDLFEDAEALLEKRHQLRGSGKSRLAAKDEDDAQKVERPQ